MKADADEVATTSGDDGVLVVGFAGTSAGGDFSMILMRNVDPGPTGQDVALGHDTYYVEIDDQSRGGYGGIAAAELSRDRLTITFDETGQHRLGLGDDTIDIAFELADDAFADLAKRLGQIFEHEPITTAGLDRPGS